MAEFRKLFYALGVAALLAGVSTTAKAQNIVCSVGSGSTPAVVRAESFADLVGDFVLDCVGGTPTTPGAVVPSVNIIATLSTNITSKILDTTFSASGNFTEALLIVDEPNRGPAYNARPLLACGAPGAPYDPNVPGVCRIIAPASPISTYDGTPSVTGTTACVAPPPGSTVPNPLTFGCGRPNVFQGRQASGIQGTGNTNVMVWNGVPFDPPGPIPAVSDNPHAGHRQLRITNIRANSPTITGGFLLPEITMSINISGNVSMSIPQPTQRVASVAPGLQPTLVSPSLTSFVQCVAESRTANLRFREGFAASFKPKGLEQYIANGTAANVLKYNPLNPASYGSGIVNQNVPGANYFSESGFVSLSGATTPTGSNPTPNPPNGIITGDPSTGGTALVNTTNISLAGIATQGTRIAATFSNLPLGMSVSVPNVVALVESATQLRTGVAVRTAVVSARGDGPFSPFTGTSSIVAGDMAVYEILFADPSANEDIVIPITITNPATNLASDLPEVNKIGQVAGGFAPFILSTDDSSVWGRAQLASETVSSFPTRLPVPRFRNTGTPVDLFRVNKCACNLLFPFITNAPAPDRNFDTGIALANTSLTPGAASSPAQRFGFVGNTSQSGPVQFWFYPANATDPPVATKCTNTVSPDTCPSPTTGPSAVQAGETLLYVLSSGSTRWGLRGAPGFTGYMIAQASFQYCHAFAYISPQGATPLTNGMSVGYIALQLDNTSLPSRTGLPAEVLGH
jgi:hypothetical protein